MSTLAVNITLTIIRYMNANTLLNDEMSLEEKLLAIEQALANAQADFNVKNGRVDAPIDPAELTMCEGCQ